MYDFFFVTGRGYINGVNDNQTAYIPATYLTNPQGSLVIDPYTGGPLVVPAGYDPQAVANYYQTFSGTTPFVGPMIPALYAINGAAPYYGLLSGFLACHPDDLQRSFNGVTDSGYYSYALKDAASFNLGFAAAAAGLSFNDAAFFGGGYNSLKGAFDYGTTPGGVDGLAPGNYENIVAGYNYYYFGFMGLNPNLYMPYDAAQHYNPSTYFFNFDTEKTVSLSTEFIGNGINFLGVNTTASVFPYAKTGNAAGGELDGLSLAPFSPEGAAAYAAAGVQGSPGILPLGMANPNPESHRIWPRLCDGRHNGTPLADTPTAAPAGGSSSPSSYNYITVDPSTPGFGGGILPTPSIRERLRT